MNNDVSQNADQFKFSAPGVLNLKISGGLIFAHVYIFFLLPLYLLPLSAWWGLTLFPLALTHSTQWAMIHEAIHKHLHENSKVNEYGGRTLSIMFGVSFHILRFGHLMHHKLNRNWQSELVTNNNLKAKLDYFVNLFGGLYITEVISGFLMAILPHKIFLHYAGKTESISHSEVMVAGQRFFYQKGNVKALRFDVIILTVLYIAAFWLYGANAFILAGFIASRAVVISFMDNIYHYGTAAYEAGKNLHLPKFVAKLLLNSNYHETHHKNPQVPWNKLPEMHERQCKIFSGGFVQHGFMQFNGPIVKAL